MSRRCTSPQALDALMVIRDLIDKYEPMKIGMYDCEKTTKDKLHDNHKLADAMIVVSSFIANPDRGANK